MKLTSVLSLFSLIMTGLAAPTPGDGDGDIPTPATFPQTGEFEVIRLNVTDLAAPGPVSPAYAYLSAFDIPCMTTLTMHQP